MSNKVVAMKGIVPKFQKKDHFIFAKDIDDFALQTGSKGYMANQGPHKGKNIATSDKYNFILCTRASDIVGLVNIEVSITKAYKESVPKRILLTVKREIEICNFQSSQHIRLESIPTVLREAMDDLD